MHLAMTIPPSLRTGCLSLRAERSNPVRGVPCLDCFTLRVRNDGPASLPAMTARS
ncbi:MAG: hypothetical protein LBT00_14840 [Spirochaetaceae bacterium]|nr:hypothetical protein [Spirochaetaceae bacterium]